MPSKYVFDYLESKGIDLSSGDALRYNLYDNFATAEDLTVLFETLESVKDKNGNPAVFTVISIVANPDFQKIKDSGFRQYFYEPFTDTLNRFPGCEKSFDLWKDGIENRLFIPEFHGREHLNVQVWMRALQSGDSIALLAFDNYFWGYNNYHKFNINFLSAFELDYPEDIEYQHRVIKEGLYLFEKLFGYKAKYFVSPNGPYNKSLETTACKNGIKFIFTAKIHHESLGDGKKRRVYHYLGQRNHSGQFYITRNAVFEPSKTGKDWINSCLNDISISFRMKKPAIISTHRVNYVGAHSTANRDNGIKQLKILLNEIMNKWPEVEFMTTSELGTLMEK